MRNAQLTHLVLAAPDRLDFAFIANHMIEGSKINGTAVADRIRSRQDGPDAN